MVILSTILDKVVTDTPGNNRVVRSRLRQGSQRERVEMDKETETILRGRRNGQSELRIRQQLKLEQTKRTT